MRIRIVFADNIKSFNPEHANILFFSKKDEETKIFENLKKDPRLFWYMDLYLFIYKIKGETLGQLKERIYKCIACTSLDRANFEVEYPRFNLTTKFEFIPVVKQLFEPTLKFIYNNDIDTSNDETDSVHLVGDIFLFCYKPEHLLYSYDVKKLEKEIDDYDKEELTPHNQAALRVSYETLKQKYDELTKFFYENFIGDSSYIKRPKSPQPKFSAHLDIDLDTLPPGPPPPLVRSKGGEMIKFYNRYPLNSIKSDQDYKKIKAGDVAIFFISSGKCNEGNRFMEFLGGRRFGRGVEVEPYLRLPSPFKSKKRSKTKSKKRSKTKSKKRSKTKK